MIKGKEMRKIKILTKEQLPAFLKQINKQLDKALKNSPPSKLKYYIDKNK